MKRALFFSFVLFGVLCFNATKAQYIHYGIHVIDSTVFTLEPSDSLHHHVVFSNDIVKLDTSGTHLWAIGRTTKTFFSSGDSTYSYVTDLTNPYPINANDWFVLKITHPFLNIIVGFTHKYQTSLGHDGGIVEFSLDSGTNWQNIKGDCNADSTHGHGVLTNNFYTKADTLANGQAAFSGSSSSWIYSEFQFFTGIPIKPAKGIIDTTNGGANGATGASCNFMFGSIYVRFRFVSDSTVDTLSGWAIDNIKVRVDDYGGAVHNANMVNQLNVFPNPSNIGSFTFPALKNEQDYTLEIYNVIGERILKQPYTHFVDITKYATGMYLYRVSNGTNNYSGTLIKE